MIRNKLQVFAFLIQSLLSVFIPIVFSLQKKKAKTMSKNNIIIKLSSLKACDQEVIISLLADQDQSKGNPLFCSCLSLIHCLLLYCILFVSFSYFFILVVDNVNLSFYTEPSLSSSPPLELSNSPIANSLLELGTCLSLEAKYNDYESLAGMCAPFNHWNQE
jgi:hypothetical protein